MAAPRKRLIICCDGTGRDSIREKNDYVTNVARFARCIESTAPDGAVQLVYYHEGVAMHGGQFQYREAATGQGIHSMVQDAYNFLCLNFDFNEYRQSEIHLVGFSRGAFAVRALACFIEDVGILSKTRVAFLSMMYSLWRNRDLDTLQHHIDAWESRGHLRRNITIESCGVWDTVSAMYPAKDLGFVAARVPSTLRNAFQALSLHEMRTSFPPVLWDEVAGSSEGKKVKQCWLAGDHSDIGGGHRDSGLATISLLWMVARFRATTNIAFAEVVLLDCMTPMYLHWQEEALFNWEEKTIFNKKEYAMQSHIYTGGHVHGPESWSTTLWHMPGQSSLIIREVFFKLKKLNTEESAPPGRGRNKSKFFRKHVGSRGAPAIPVLTLPDEDIFKLPGSGVVSTSVEDSPRIHFTVRILMAQRKQPCILLENLTNIRHGDEIAWVDVTGARGILEDVPTAWESWLFRQWIKREEHLFNSEPSDSAERFTRFLHPYRREGERPRKAFFSPAPRASSVDRSRKIKDADDMVSEASEKAPDLTQSRSSAATSVNSGVRYYLDLEYEGFLPERYRKSGIEHGMDRSFYRPKAER